MVLNNLEELFNLIEIDINSFNPTSSRYPIRWIFINNYADYYNLKEYFKNSGIKNNDLSNLLKSDDSWFTVNSLVEFFKSIKEKTIVSSFSNVLRLLDENKFSKLCRKLSEYETNENIKIYLPIIGLWEKFNKYFFYQYHRKEFFDKILWFVNGDYDSYKLYKVNFNVDEKVLNSLKKKYFIIRNVKEWVNLFENESEKIEDKNIISISLVVNRISKNIVPDSIFDYEDINNEIEIYEKLFRIKFNIFCRKDEKKYFNDILKYLLLKEIKISSFKDIIKEIFNINSIKKLDFENFLREYFYSKKVEFKWLITKNYYKEDYLKKVINNLKYFNNNELIIKIWSYIYEIENVEYDFFDERRKLLNFIKDKLNINIILDEDLVKINLKKLKKLKFDNAIEYLSTYTIEEKKYLFDLLNRSENKNEFKKNISKLKNIYPELYYYIEGWKFLNLDIKIEKWINTYFYNYCISKVINEKKNEVEKIINEKNKCLDSFSKWFYNLKNIKDYIEKDSNKIWIDGLGLEWLPLLKYLINKYTSLNINKVVIGHVNLPSSTKCNAIEDSIKINNLDSFIHNQNPYKYPESLIDEIDILKDIVKINLANLDKKTIIVSDHGFTFLAQKQYGSIKVFDFEKSSHEGRYLKIDDKREYSNDEYYFKWRTENGKCKNNFYLIALKHFSLDYIPYREVHGGATPEEIIVPLIEIGPLDSNEKIEYKITPKKSIIIDYKNPTFKISIVPNPKNDFSILKDKKELNKEYLQDENKWLVYFKGGKIGNNKIKVIIGDYEEEIEVIIKAGFEEDDLI